MAELPKQKQTLILSPKETDNLAGYIRDCEVDQLQLSFCENRHKECLNDLKTADDTVTKVVLYAIFFGLGYHLGSDR